MCEQKEEKKITNKMIIIIIERINRPRCCEESKKRGRRTANPVQEKLGEEISE